MAANGEADKELIVHRRGYESFITLFRTGAIVCAIIAFIVYPDHQLSSEARRPQGDGRGRAARRGDAGDGQEVHRAGRRASRSKRARALTASIADAGVSRGGRRGRRSRARRCCEAPTRCSACRGRMPAALTGAKPGAWVVAGARSVRRARARRRLCGGRARGAGDGVHAAHHPRAVDGHPVLAVEPVGLQGGARRRRANMAAPSR